MKTIIVRFVCLSLAWVPLCLSAQYSGMEADYKKATTAYEQQDRNSRQLLEAHLKEYPDSPYANQVHALIASTWFFEADYPRALKAFQSSDFSRLDKAERDDMTFRLAYIRYTQRRYEEALNDFIPLQSTEKYATLVPYYIADIYLQLKQYDNVMAIAQQYLSASVEVSDMAYAAQMHRILGEAYYHKGDYHNAANFLGSYISQTEQPTRTALYMAGISYYQIHVFSQAAEALGEVIKVNDNLTQNAYLHLGLAYLQLSERDKARMAFEQAAAYNVDPAIKEQAAYNYALCIHETSGFDESTTLFERFLNDFPHSAYADKVNCYLVDAYATTGSYEAALESIRRISNPEAKVMTAKQKLLFLLGTQAFTHDSFEKAVDYFSQSIRIGQCDPQTHADTYNRIGDSYFQMRNFDEAKHYYSQAEALETPAGDYSFYRLALISGLQKDYAGKITLLNRLSGKYPDSPYGARALYEKGRSYMLMENNDQAVAAYKKVINDYPESAEAHLALGDIKSIYIDQNKVSEYAELAASLPGHTHIDANEQDSLTYIAAERIYMRGRSQEAKESFTRYLQSFPEGRFGLNAHYYLALVARSQKDNTNLLIHTGKVLQDPDNPFSEEALVMQSEVQYARQMYKESLATYKQLAATASTAEHRLLGKTGAMRSAYLLDNDAEMIQTADDMLAEAKLSPELTNEALYYRAKALLKQGASQAAMTDLRTLAKDTRNLYGAEAKYLVAEQLYNARNYGEAEREILHFIEESTPHAYWLARGIILLSDVYVATGKTLDARQYLLNLQKNYTTDDNIQPMIENRLKKLNNKQQ